MTVVTMDGQQKAKLCECGSEAARLTDHPTNCLVRKGAAVREGRLIVLNLEEDGESDRKRRAVVAAATAPADGQDDVRTILPRDLDRGYDPRLVDVGPDEIVEIIESTVTAEPTVRSGRGGGGSRGKRRKAPVKKLTQYCANCDTRQADDLVVCQRCGAVLPGPANKPGRRKKANPKDATMKLRVPRATHDAAKTFGIDSKWMRSTIEREILRRQSASGLTSAAASGNI